MYECREPLEFVSEARFENIVDNPVHNHSLVWILKWPFPNIANQLTQILKSAVDDRLVINKTQSAVEQLENKSSLLFTRFYYSLDVLTHFLELKQGKVPFQDIDSQFKELRSIDVGVGEVEK